MKIFLKNFHLCWNKLNNLDISEISSNLKHWRQRKRCLNLNLAKLRYIFYHYIWLNMNELIQQKIRQYLVHSFLYYQLDESIISDMQYDHICADVAKLISDNSAKNSLPFDDLLKSSLTDNVSGFSINKYPPEIVSAALHLLYQTSYIDSMSFETFLTRFGYSGYEIRNA